MNDTTDQLHQRLLFLIEQTERDCTALRSSGMEQGLAAYTRLFDSLTATLHNLERPSAVKKRVD